MTENDPKDTYVQLSKPYFTIQEIAVIEKHNDDLYQNIRNYKSKFKDTFQILITLSVRLNIPIKVLQNTSYFYQKFFLLNNNYKKYANLHFEIGIASLFMALKLNDYIKKINIVIQEAFLVKGIHLSSADIDENKKIIISLERKILEFQSFDFRNFLSEEFLIKYLKTLNTSPQIQQQEKTYSYLSWSSLNDLYLTSLVLQFPAHYNAIISLKCTDLILDEFTKENITCTNDNQIMRMDLTKLINEKNDAIIMSGCNQLLEYYIDNLSTTFLKDSLTELGFEIGDKKLIDLLINIKIVVNTKLSKGPVYNATNLESDMFFHPRNTDIAKVGSLRFVYNEHSFTEEVALYK